MTRPSANTAPQGNALTSDQLHRRERFRSIILPMLATLIAVVVAIAILVVILAKPELRVVTNCMAALLMSFAAVTCLLAQVLLLAMIWGTGLLYGKTGVWMSKARNLALRGRIMALRATRVVASPVIGFNRAFTSLETGLRSLRRPRLATDVQPAETDQHEQ